MLTTLDRRHSTGPMELDLSARRARNDRKLKSIFERIFDKYEKDFSRVGDEIDLATGQIVVNNGHLQSLDDEGDPGDLSDTDILNSDEVDEVSRGKISLKNQKYKDSLGWTSPSMDSGFVISAAERTTTYKILGRSPRAHAQSRLPEVDRTGLQSPSDSSSIATYKRNPDDRSIEPMWRAPRLPIDSVLVQETPSTTSLEFQEEIETPPSPSNQSIWASLGPKRGLKRKSDYDDNASIHPKRRKIPIWTPDHGARQRGNIMSEPRIRSASVAPKYKKWTPEEDELLIAMRSSSLRGKLLYTNAFPGRHLSSIHAHWTRLRYHFPEKVASHRHGVVPQHLKALHHDRSSPRANSIQPSRSLPNRLTGFKTISDEQSRPSVSSELATASANKAPCAMQAMVSNFAQNDTRQEQNLAVLGRETEIRRAVIPDSQEDEDLELLDMTVNSDLGNRTNLRKKVGRPPAAMVAVSPIATAETEITALANDEAQHAIERLRDPDTSPDFHSNADSHTNEINDGDEGEETSHTQSEAVGLGPSRSSRLQNPPKKQPISHRASLLVPDNSSPKKPSSTTQVEIIPNSSTDVEAPPSTSVSTKGIRKSLLPGGVDIRTTVSKDGPSSRSGKGLNRAEMIGDDILTTTNSSSPLNGHAELSQGTPKKISLAPKMAWKKPQLKEPSKRRSLPTTVVCKRVLDPESEDELAGTSVERLVTPSSAVKAARSRRWEKVLTQRRKSR